MTDKVPICNGQHGLRQGVQEHVFLFYCFHNAHTVQRHVIEKDEVQQIAVVRHRANCFRYPNRHVVGLHAVLRHDHLAIALGGIGGKTNVHRGLIDTQVGAVTYDEKVRHLRVLSEPLLQSGAVCRVQGVFCHDREGSGSRQAGKLRHRI